MVKSAGMTGGAPYRHFDGQKGLFDAVLCEAQQEIGRRIEKRSEAASDRWEQLVNGCHGFLEASSDPKPQRIVVIDAPAMVTWETVRFVDATVEGSGFPLAKECLEDLQAERIIKPLPVNAPARQFNAAMDEAAVWIARASDNRKALKEAKIVLNILLTALKA